MKTKTFVPSMCSGEDAEFEGSVELRLPTFDEKFDYLESLNVQIGDDGAVDSGDAMNKVKMMRKMVNLSKAHYVKVEIKNKASGEEYKSYEDLSSDADCHPILIEVAGKLMQGFKVGNG